MKIGLLLFLFFLLLFNTGCAADALSPFVGTPRRRVGEAYEITVKEEPIPFTVLFPSVQAALAMHEPGEGILLGAWLDAAGHISPRCFVAKSENRHALFAHALVLGEEVPFLFILQTLVAEAVPLIFLHPNPDLPHDPMPVPELVDLARGMGAYEAPMFLAFYPLESMNEMEAELFVATFRLARIVFRVYAPQVAFVWLAPGGDAAATVAHPFYPGHDVVDWVGIGATALRTRDEPVDILAYIAPFYYSFQRHKPIMLLPIGISHFSRVRYAYYITETAKEIARVYAALAAFPRVGAVVYRDAHRYGPRWDALALTRDCAVMAAYTQAVRNTLFLSELTAAEQARTPLWMRSAFSGHYYNGVFYVDTDTALYELRIPFSGPVTERNERFFADITYFGAPVTACFDTRIIHLHLPIQ